MSEDEFEQDAAYYELQIIHYKEVVGILLDAVRFYANPESYRALLLAADPPCGDFIRDFNVVEGAYTDRPMPGKYARDAIKEIMEKYPDLLYLDFE